MSLRIGDKEVSPAKVVIKNVVQTETLNVTPTTSPQVINPTGDIGGFNPVLVSAVTSSIDPNISPENIRKGISILGVVGTYEGE